MAHRRVAYHRVTHRRVAYRRGGRNVLEGIQMAYKNTQNARCPLYLDNC